MFAHRLIFGLLAVVLVSTLTVNTFAQAITARVDLSDGQPQSGDEVEVEVVVDLSDVSDKLGAYSAKLVWDADVLRFMEVADGETAAFAGPQTNASAGQLLFSNFSTGGAGGLLSLIKVKFEVVGEAGERTALTLSFTALDAASTFKNLLPQLQVQLQSEPNTSIVIRSSGAVEPSPDVDGDGNVGFRDFVLFAQAFGFSQGEAGFQAVVDLDGSGDIGFRDFVIFAQFFGKDPSTFRSDAGSGTSGEEPPSGVPGEPKLEVSPERVEVGGDPQKTTIQLRNVSSGTLTWTISEGEIWLGVTSSQGDTGGDGVFSGEGDVELTVNTGGLGLQDGLYEAVIEIRSNGGDVDVPVKMAVRGATTGDSTVVTLPVGNVDMAFVYISSGTFTMGSPDLEPGRESDKGPQHEVTIREGFYLGKYEVTQGQWEAVMGSNPSLYSGSNKPVERVSWHDVQEFVQRLNAAAGDSLYRLPTEAEWEYACRAGTTTRWSFGDEESKLTDYAWYEGNNSPSGPKEVGTKLRNPWGLYDMHGNVWEWCQDWYGSYSSGDQVDPQGPATGLGRVSRGGFFLRGARDVRSAGRGSVSPGERFLYLGFRLLRRAR